MNKFITGLVVLAAALTITVVFYMRGGGEDTHSLPASAEIVADAPREAPMTAVGDARTESKEDSDTEIVLGLEVRKDRNCTVEKHMVHLGDGLVTEAYSCDPPPTEDPFAAYSDADLSVMSYSDAGAAEELGKRLLFQQREGPANEMMLRAVALEPDDVKPLLYLLSQTGSLRGDVPEARKAVGNAYIITKTASHFDPKVNTRWLREDLIEYRFVPEDIERLDRIVDGNLDRMRRVQIEVFGESRIGEAL